jgi:LysR family glycine cleavage system transcriptional activator
MGVALVPRFLVEDDLASERLVVLFRDALVTDRAYYVVTPDSGAENRLVLAFREWLVAEAATSLKVARKSRSPAAAVVK